MAKLEFFFDCSSPWTYLAFSRVEAICERAAAEIEWRPILVGGVFIALDAGALPAYAKSVFEAYWGEGKDISESEVLRQICVDVGLDEKTFFDGLTSTDIKARLRKNTEELIERGGFGSPTMFVNGDDMFFGNDRLPLVEQALGL